MSLLRHWVKLLGQFKRRLLNQPPKVLPQYVLDALGMAQKPTKARAGTGRYRVVQLPTPEAAIMMCALEDCAQANRDIEAARTRANRKGQTLRDAIAVRAELYGMYDAELSADGKYLVERT